MRKITKTLIILILIGLFIIVSFSKYAEEKNDISNKIGNVWTGGQISTVNHATISRAFNKYLEYLKNEQYEEAYRMLSYDYTVYKDYETFLNEIKGVNYENARIEDIIRRTDFVYSIIINTDDTKKENLLIFNAENTAYSIRPETFLEHKDVGEELKKRNVKYEVVDTVNYIDKFIANINITNLNKKDSIKISDIKLINGDEHISGNINDIVLNPQESKMISVEFETYIDFPNQIEISRYIEKKDSSETYIFNLE